MKDNVRQHLELLLSRYPVLEPCKQDLEHAYCLLKETYENDGKLLVCGNGGSAADADHITGELMKGFYKPRKLPDQQIEKYGMNGQFLQGALPCIALTQHSALFTAYLNDVKPEMVFAQQVYGYGKPGDCFMGISTSGNAANVCAAAEVAKAGGLYCIGLTGKQGGRLAQISDVTIRVPETVTAFVQELHLPVYHTLCAMLEEHFFAD